MSTSSSSTPECCYQSCSKTGTHYGCYNGLWRYACDEHDERNNPKYEKKETDFSKCKEAKIFFNPKSRKFSCSNCNCHWLNYKLPVCPNSAPLANQGLNANVNLTHMTFHYDIEQQKLNK